ncbi:MAG: WecB/TagA/CpsF family glycosyltransferase [Lachnospiraceae bacterium]
MSKPIELLGIKIDNYTVRESILQLEAFLSNNILNIIKTVSMEQILMAGENLSVRNAISQADLTLIKERELLMITGNESLQRLREIQDNTFLIELVNRIVKNKKRIYLIADSKANLEKMNIFFQQVNEEFSAEGEHAVNEYVNDMDALINLINSTDPDIILSSMGSPKEEEILNTYKNRITATVWFSLGEYYSVAYRGLHFIKFLRRFLIRKKLQMELEKYKSGTGAYI